MSEDDLPLGSSVTFTYGYNKDHQRNSLGVDDGDFLYHPAAASSTAYAANVWESGSE